MPFCQMQKKSLLEKNQASCSLIGINIQHLLKFPLIKAKHWSLFFGVFQTYGSISAKNLHIQT